MPGPVFNHGYINDEWQKLPFLFGVSDTIAQVNLDTSGGTGVNTYDGDPVPDGEIWVITNLINGTQAAAAGGLVDTALVLGGVAATVYRSQAPAAGAAYDKQGWWVMVAGDFIRTTVSGLAAGQYYFTSAIGFKMDIDL